MKWNSIHRYFLRDPVDPVDGMIAAPGQVGLGTDLDEGKIETDDEVFAA